VTITEQSGNDLVDYPVKVVITDPQFFEECPDQKYIECYFQDGSWIPHWVEEFDPANNKAVIWVKVPQIPANGTVKVMIKVNPSRTEDLSNGKAIFEFFDDFEDADISDWIIAKIGGSGGYAKAEDGYLKLKSTDSGVATAVDRAFTCQNIILEAKVKCITAHSLGMGFSDGQHAANGNQINAYKVSFQTSGVYLMKRQNDVRYDLASTTNTAYTILKGETAIVGLAFISPYLAVFKNYEKFLEGNDPTWVSRDYISFDVWGSEYWIDWVRVRKYIEPEPAVTVEYVSETVTYTDYFYWGMAKMLSGAIANLMQLPIKMEIYSGGNLLKTLSLKEISTITDAENKYIISVLKFEDNSSDSYQTDKQIVYVTDPNGNLRKLAESTYVFIKMAELPLLLGFEIRVPYEDTQVELS